MSDAFPAAPRQDALQRLQWSITRRTETDYQAEFWTALGWTVLTCGIYGFYVFYRLMWRSVEHNRRRLEVLDSAVALAWERAVAQGRGDELTPRFQQAAAHLGVLRHLTTEFRDPTLWTIISIFSSGVGHIIGYVFIDQDLVRHDAAEHAVEHELAAIFSALGAPLAPPAARQLKQAHSYGGRIAALLLTCGIYGLWWQYDLMVEGNAHHRANWASEDELWAATAGLAAA